MMDNGTKQKPIPPKPHDGERTAVTIVPFRPVKRPTAPRPPERPVDPPPAA